MVFVRHALVPTRSSGSFTLYGNLEVFRRTLDASARLVSCATVCFARIWTLAFQDKAKCEPTQQDVLDEPWHPHSLRTVEVAELLVGVAAAMHALFVDRQVTLRISVLNVHS